MSDRDLKPTKIAPLIEVIEGPQRIRKRRNSLPSVRETQIDEATVRSVFNKFDTDHSGLIDKSEFRAVLEELLKTHVSDEVFYAFCEQQFKIVDRDFSGSIDFEEFKTFYRSLAPVLPNNPVVTLTSHSPPVVVVGSSTSTTGTGSPNTIRRKSPLEPIISSANSSEHQPPQPWVPTSSPVETSPRISASTINLIPSLSQPQKPQPQPQQPQPQQQTLRMVRVKTENGTRGWEIAVSNDETVDGVVARINRDFLDQGEVVDKLFVWEPANPTTGQPEERRLVKKQHMILNFFQVFGHGGMIITRRAISMIMTNPSASDYL